MELGSVIQRGKIFIYFYQHDCGLARASFILLSKNLQEFKIMPKSRVSDLYLLPRGGGGGGDRQNTRQSEGEGEGRVYME